MRTVLALLVAALLAGCDFPHVTAPAPLLVIVLSAETAYDFNECRTAAISADTVLATCDAYETQTMEIDPNAYASPSGPHVAARLVIDGATFTRCELANPGLYVCKARTTNP
jgi:hypothetical protein